MAINASMQWWIRQSGNVLNGGGFDSAVTNAGTNYADQDAPQLSLTDLATPSANSTTLTSATGGFTAAMIGNVIRIASGTNFTAGYYVVTAYTDTNTVTLDRTPSPADIGSSGVGRLGGAFATPWGNLASSGTVIASPLAGGHKINVRGSGSTNPTSADYTQTGYFNYANGDSNGSIHWLGYNGTPLWQGNGLIIFNPNSHFFENIFFKVTGNNAGGGNGIVNGRNSFFNCKFDQNGNDIAGVSESHNVAYCYFFNSGSTTAGTSYAISPGAYAPTYYGNYINGWRAGGISVDSDAAIIVNNIIANCKGITSAIEMAGGGAGVLSAIIGNTIVNNSGDGVRHSQIASRNIPFYNNIIANNGGYGRNFTVGTTAENNRVSKMTFNNNYFGNASGVINGISLAATDTTLDPQFINASGGNFSVGANMKNIGFPTSFLGSATNNYLDIGAVQSKPNGSLVGPSLLVS